MGRWQHPTHLHYPDFVWCSTNRIKPTLWDTEAAVVGVAVAEHARGGIADHVSRRDKCFLNKVKDTFGSDGSVEVDVTEVLNFNISQIGQQKWPDSAGLTRNG